MWTSTEEECLLRAREALEAAANVVITERGKLAKAEIALHASRITLHGHKLDPARQWELILKLGGQSQTSTRVGVIDPISSNVLSCDQKAAETLNEYFASVNGVLNEPTSTHQLPVHDPSNVGEAKAATQQQELLPHLERPPEVQAELLAKLNEPIHTSEVQSILVRLPNRKASGNDGLRYEMLKLAIRGTARAINMNPPSLEEEEMAVQNVLESLAEESKDILQYKMVKATTTSTATASWHKNCDA